VQELCSKGYSQREASQILQVGLVTVNKSQEEEVVSVATSSDFILCTKSSVVIGFLISCDASIHQSPI
jgi:hypothetical protein